MRICTGCKKHFMPNDSKRIQKYCSRNCQLKYNTGRFKKGHEIPQNWLEKMEKTWFKKGNQFWLGKKYTGEREEKRLKSWIKSIHLKPNKKEKELLQIITEMNLPYKFVGDGQVTFGNKIPDFINCNGQKKIIELFGNYWHTKEHESERIKHFAEYGFKTLIIWENELRNINEVKEKMIKFEGAKNEVDT